MGSPRNHIESLNGVAGGRGRWGRITADCGGDGEAQGSAVGGVSRDGPGELDAIADALRGECRRGLREMERRRFGRAGVGAAGEKDRGGCAEGKRGPRAGR